jgi:RNA polymerase sigma-32 factor
MTLFSTHGTPATSPDKPKIALGENRERDNRHRTRTEARTVGDTREDHIPESCRFVEKPVGLNGLADAFGASRERMRQVQASASEKLRKSVTACIAVMGGV